MTFAEAIRDFFDDQDYKGNSPATIRFYRQNLDHFQRDTGITDLDEFSTSTIRRWIVSHKDVNRTTLATYDRALRVIANWLHRRGYLDANPMDDLPKPKARRGEIETFNPDEIKAMLREAGETQNPMRDRAMLALFLDTGIRRRELVDLELHDVDWSDGIVRIDGKTGERVVPFGRKCKLALRRYIDQERNAAAPSIRHVLLSQTGEKLTPGAVTQHVIMLARSAGVQAAKLGPHTFRHTFAVEFIRAGGDAFSLQRLLGHSTLDMTRKYVHLAQSDLRAAHKRYAPGDRLLT